MEWCNLENWNIKQLPTVSWIDLNSDFAPKSCALAVTIAFTGPFWQISHLQTLSSCLEDILTSSVILCHQLQAGKEGTLHDILGIINDFMFHSMLKNSTALRWVQWKEKECKPSMMSFRLLFPRTATETWPEIMCSAGEALQLQEKENGFPLTNLWGKGISQGACKGQKSLI